MTVKKEIINCQKCGTGKHWWISGPICPVCQGNPILGNGRDDWYDFWRYKMIKQFGVRREGDAELLVRYQEEDEQ